MPKLARTSWGETSVRPLRKAATAPAATAVAWLVPLPRKSLPLREPGLAWAIALSSGRIDSTCTPAATTSGLRIPAGVPRPLKGDDRVGRGVGCADREQLRVLAGVADLRGVVARCGDDGDACGLHRVGGVGQRVGAVAVGGTGRAEAEGDDAWLA